MAGLKRAGWGLLALALFILALALMKEGARGIEPLLEGFFRVTNPADSLGFGWLMAALILSGSPVAAVAVALLSADALQPAQAFTMITGSRMGASLVVLLLGFVYSLRRRKRWPALTAGVLSLLISASAQALALPMGLWMLNWGWFGRLRFPGLEGASGGLNRWIDPLIQPVATALPDWMLFIAGVGLVSLSFHLFDRALPHVRLQRTEFGQVPRLIYRPWMMFLIGLAVTALTMSVSISVGILVPLSARGYVRRENIIPYILGANISTLVDTLLAALLLGDPRGVWVVTAQMAAMMIVSLPVILFAYWPYERFISRALAWVTRDRRHFAVFLVVTFAIPVVLILC